MSLETALQAVLIMAGVTFLTRALPFALFSGRRPPQFLRQLEASTPPMIMLILVLYCLKDVPFSNSFAWMPEVLGILAVAVLHLFKRNALLSVFGGTVFYMILVQQFFKN